MRVIEKITRTLKWLTGSIVVAIFSWMIFLATAQLILRWLKVDALGWSDVQLRYLLLWYGLAGGVLATGESRHIHIDLATHYFPKRFISLIARGISILSSMIALYLAYLSIQFLASEIEGGSRVPGLVFGFEAPIWWIELGLPLAFTAMGLLFFLQTFLPIPDHVNDPVLK